MSTDFLKTWSKKLNVGKSNYFSEIGYCYQLMSFEFDVTLNDIAMIRRPKRIQNFNGLLFKSYPLISKNYCDE